jgi:hypothetical protein
MNGGKSEGYKELLMIRTSYMIIKITLLCMILLVRIFGVYQQKNSSEE